MAKKKLGRPPVELDKEQFEKLCSINCTMQEIADWFFVDIDTMTAWCKRTYNQHFSEVYRQKKSRGKISLRRSLWQGALEDKNVVLKLFLAKNHLGMSDNGMEDDSEENELDLNFTKREKV